MYIVPIGWLYVTMMMAVVEATSDTGTVLGGIITFALYGLLPTSIIWYLMSTPARKRAIKAREASELAAELAAMPPSPQPDASSHAPAAAQGNAVPPVRKEP
jgi:hypothetical protein